MMSQGFDPSDLLDNTMGWSVDDWDKDIVVRGKEEIDSKTQSASFIRASDLEFLIEIQ